MRACFAITAPFLRDHVKERRPVVLRGAGSASPALRLWSQDYLKTHYGDLRVKLETKREKAGRLLGAEGGLGRSSIRTFFDSLQHRDA